MRKKFNNKIHLSGIAVRELLEDVGIHYRESGKNISSNWIGVNCPFCDDQSEHLGINLNSKKISCWKCGKTSTILSLVSKHLGSFEKALKITKEHIPRELRLEEEKDKSGVEEVFLPKLAKPGLSEYHKQYLRGRNFDPDFLSDKYNLYHVGPVGDFSNRIIVPVTKNYQLVTFTSIDIHDDSILRYKHWHEEESIIPVKKLLYGEEFCDGHNIIVVEGIFDFWRLGDGCVPLFGVNFTSEQKLLMSKYPNIKAVGDGDPEGWKFNKRVADELSPFSRVTCFDLEEDIDPDKLSEEEIRYIKQKR